MGMSNCIKPRTKVSIFGSLNVTAGGWAHMPWLGPYILSRWSPSYEHINQPSAQVYSDIRLKFRTS